MSGPWALSDTNRHTKHCAGLALAIGLLCAVTRPRVIEICHGGLVEIPEPSGWKSWARVPTPSDTGDRLGPFVVSGRLLMPKYGLGLTDVSLFDPRICKSSSIDLDAWFERGPEPNYSRSASELQLRRREDDTFVVAASVWMPPDPPRGLDFVAAFRRELGGRLSFVSADAAALGATLATSLLSAVWGWRSARRARVAFRIAVLALGLAGVICLGAWWSEVSRSLMI